MAHLLPGVYVEAILAISQIHFATDLPKLAEKKLETEISVLFLVAAFFLALLIGHLCDAVRNLLESRWDDGKWWDFFVKADPEHVAIITEQYFRYYELDANLVIGSVFAGILTALLCSLSLWLLVGLVVVTCIFLLDAISLRAELKKVAAEVVRVARQKASHENHVQEEKK